MEKHILSTGMRSNAGAVCSRSLRMRASTSPRNFCSPGRTGRPTWSILRRGAREAITIMPGISAPRKTKTDMPPCSAAWPKYLTEGMGWDTSATIWSEMKSTPIPSGIIQAPIPSRKTPICTRILSRSSTALSRINVQTPVSVSAWNTVGQQRSPDGSTQDGTSWIHLPSGLRNTEALILRSATTLTQSRWPRPISGIIPVNGWKIPLTPPASRWKTSNSWQNTWSPPTARRPGSCSQNRDSAPMGRTGRWNRPQPLPTPIIKRNLTIWSTASSSGVRRTARERSLATGSIWVCGQKAWAGWNCPTMCSSIWIRRRAQRTQKPAGNTWGSVTGANWCRDMTRNILIKIYTKIAVTNAWMNKL